MIDDLLSILPANIQRTNCPHFYSSQKWYRHHGVCLNWVVQYEPRPTGSRIRFSVIRLNNALLGEQVLGDHREGNQFSLCLLQGRRRIRKSHPLNQSTKCKLTWVKLDFYIKPVFDSAQKLKLFSNSPRFQCDQMLLQYQLGNWNLLQVQMYVVMLLRMLPKPNPWPSFLFYIPNYFINKKVA